MIDFHVHFFPESVFKAIWRFFDADKSGLWKVRYKLSGTRHVEAMRSFGVKRFTTLIYAHKKGLASVLNEYVYEWAQKTPEILPFGTIFAGDGNTQATALQLFDEFKFQGIKLHPFVSNEEIDDARFFPAFEVMQEKQKVLVCHPGSGPVYAAKDGAGRLENVLRQFPQLRVVVAHCGAFEYGEYPALAERYEHVYFDTAMNCVHGTFENNCPGRPFFERFQDRILFGSDFPNIPYEYQDQITALRLMNLGHAIEEKILSGNALRLLGQAASS